MEIKFVIDVGVGKAVENYLKDSNYEIICIRDINPFMSDLGILEVAVENNAVIITMDKDFGELVFHSNKPHKGVLLLRLEDKNGKEKVLVVSKILTQYKNEITNNFCVYQNGRLRIRYKR